jgi:hypothetical protein
MADERRFSEDEVAEILERATSTDVSPASGRAGSADGLTLTELQGIGAEVGIPPDRIAAAANAVGTRAVPARKPKMLLGTPRSVSRIVPIERSLNDAEWDRLVADLRHRFNAVGRIHVHGNLRTWSNGNLQVHVEPDGDRYRVRMTTLKGSALPSLGMGAMWLGVGALSITLAATGLGNPAGLPIGSTFGLVGIGQILITRLRLPGWAKERADQMEGLAEQIPRLLDEPAGSAGGSHS